MGCFAGQQIYNFTLYTAGVSVVIPATTPAATTYHTHRPLRLLHHHRAHHRHSVCCCDWCSCCPSCSCPCCGSKKDKVGPTSTIQPEPEQLYFGMPDMVHKYSGPVGVFF